MIKKRGRPPKYNEDEVLESALKLFWMKGMSSTSLDDLSTAMGMNRPSIYNAFGDKESIYRKAFARFKANVEIGVNKALLEPDLKSALQRLFSSALDVYFSGEEPIGCFCMATAAVESINYPSIKSDLNSLIDMIDGKIESRLDMAPKTDWPSTANVEHIAKMLHCILQGIAIRVRGGESRASVEDIYKSAIDLVCP